MDSLEQKFCTSCGQILSPEDRFCPICGTRVPGRNPEQVAEERAQIKQAVGSQLIWAAVLMLIYSIPFLIIGVYVGLNIDTIAHTVFTDPNMQGWIAQYGVTEAELDHYYGIAAYGYILSSIFGIVSAVLCWKKSHYWVALILCILSMFTGVTGIFALFLGIFAFWIILTGKLGFKEYEEELNKQLEEIQ